MSAFHPGRRVVTGYTSDGRSTIVQDDVLTSHTYAGVSLCAVWQLESAPTEVPAPNFEGHGRGSVAVSTTVFPPRQLVGRDRPPGAIGYDAAGFHRTNSVEIAMVSSGRVTLLLEDGSTTQLGPGDWVIQNGGLHAWRSEGEEPAVMVWVGIPGVSRSTS